MAISLLFSACSPARQTLPSTTGPTSTTSSSEVTQPSDYIVSADSFSLEDSADGIGSILTGELTPGITINARVYCERDLSDPGTGSVDTANLKVFSTEDVCILVSPDWTQTSDETFEWNYDDITTFEQRIVEYTDAKNNRISIVNSFANFGYEVQLGKLHLLSLVQRYERIPWFSSDLAWGTEEFEFGSRKEAFAELKNYAERLGVTVSPIYKIEYVTPEVFDTLCRLQVAEGNEGLPEKTWGEEDGAYWIEAAQEWNDLPIHSGSYSVVFNGTDLSGDEYRGTMWSDVSFLQTAAGVQNFRIGNALEPLEKGAEEELVSLWDGLQALKLHIDNPKYEDEILYRLPEQDVLIDQIELCYLPIEQVKSAESTDNENSGNNLETEDGGERYIYEMTPCWTFRVIWTGNSFTFAKYVAVNAITGEYILLTESSPGPA
jgi:hypothetical protein